MQQFEINTNEIKDLQLPVELKSLFIGRLSLNLPYAHLATQSIKVSGFCRDL